MAPAVRLGRDAVADIVRLRFFGSTGKPCGIEGSFELHKLLKELYNDLPSWLISSLYQMDMFAGCLGTKAKC